MTGRNIWLIITSLVVGPAFGGLTFITLAGITDAMASPNPRPPTVAGIDDYWPIDSHRRLRAGRHSGHRLGPHHGLCHALAAAALAAPRYRTLIGAVISLLGLSFLLFMDNRGSVDDLMIAGVIMLSGAVAGLCLPCHRRALPPLSNPGKVTT